ncbi:MAG: tetratricopeptide repeat protein [Bacteroidetes bacterium]|nr:tetratricopeptide repeat protein [Fibrella sp.]
MFKWALHIGLIATAFSVYAQKSNIAPVVVRLPQAGDTSRVNLLTTQCKRLWHHQLAKAANYNREALGLANKLGYKKGQAEAYRCSGIILLAYQNNTGYAHLHLQYALKTFRELNDKRGEAATLSSLSTYYIGHSQVEKARNVLLRAGQLFAGLNDQAGIGEVANQLGEASYRERDYPSALKQYRQALGIRQQLNDHVGSAFTLIRMGDLYALNNQRWIALTYYQNAYQIGQANRYNQVVANATRGMGAVEQRRKKYTEALVYYKRSLKAQEELYARKSPWPYQQIAELYKIQRKYDESLAYYKLSLETWEDSYAQKFPWPVIPVYQQIAGLYTMQKKYGESLTYLHKALGIIDSGNPIERIPLTASVLNQLGQVYLAQGNYPDALKAATRSWQLATKQRLTQIVQDASLTLSLIYAATGDYPRAYTYHRQYSALRDTLFNQEIEMRATLKNGLENNQKQDQVNLLWKENQEKDGVLDDLTLRNYALLAGVLLFFALVVVLIRNNRRNQRTNRLLAQQAKQLEEQRIRELEQTFEHRQAETEMAALRAQMNPHFIFNCLNSIKLYASDNEAAKASEYLTKFARLIRLVLENSRSERVTLSDELKALQLYGEMEVMRFKDKLSFRLEIDPGLETEFVEIPPLLIQPYIENAIWHGLMHKEAGGTVWVRVKQLREDLLQITVNDDGVGRAKAAELKSKSATKGKSFGLKMTGERIALINQVYHTQTDVQIHDLTNQQGQPAGTEVVLRIPI